MEESIHKYDRLEHFDPAHLEWFVVNWCLGNTCNFACSYCPTSLHDGSQRWHSTQNVKNFISKIRNYHPNKKIYFEFTGGEVTLNKDFIDICKYCTENDVKVGFISNGSRTIRWWEENKNYFDSVMLSYHSEFADQDHFVQVAEILNDEVRTHVNIMMKPEKHEFVESPHKIIRVMALTGVISGSFLYAVLTKNFRIEWFASIGDFVNHVIGGALMGIGGVLAMGCTVGQAITGMSTLAIGSILTFAAIVAGAVATMKYQYWRA